MDSTNIFEIVMGLIPTVFFFGGLWCWMKGDSKQALYLIGVAIYLKV